MKIYKYYRGQIHSVEGIDTGKNFKLSQSIEPFNFRKIIPRSEASPTKRDEIDRAEAQVLDEIAALTHQIETLNAEIKKINSLR
jgi:hypothetical protein